MTVAKFAELADLSEREIQKVLQPGGRKAVLWQTRVGLAKALGVKEAELGTAPSTRTKRRTSFNWVYHETATLASSSVIDSLKLAGNPSLLAIDDGVVLYLPVCSKLKRKINIAVPSKLHDYPTRTLKDPGVNDLKATLIGLQPRVEKYLSGRATATDSSKGGPFGCKVGLERIEPPVKRVGRPLMFSVRPLSYWIVREFNRRMLFEPKDRELATMRRQSLESVLRPEESVAVSCPSALYVELALVTNDRKLVLLEKNSSLSALARTSRGKWTCSLEEGLLWNRDVNGKLLDMHSCAYAGLREELEVQPSDVAELALLAIALEHTHLNTAVLGFATLKLSSKDLEPRIKKSNDFGAGFDFVPIREVQKRYFGPAASKKSVEWHPTARLRMFLTLRALGMWKA